MPYKPEEYRILNQIFFGSKKLNRLILDYLRRCGEPGRPMAEDDFLNFAATELREWVANPAWQPLLERSRLEEDSDTLKELHAMLREQLATGRLPAQPARPSLQSVPSSQPPPDPLLSYPGFPMEEQYVRQAADALGLTEREARDALRPIAPSGSYLYPSGYAYPLYHQTRHSEIKRGVKTPAGVDKITYFYAVAGGQAYLVAWGRHDDARPNSYRISNSVARPQDGMLGGELLRFSGPPPGVPKPKAPPGGPK